MDKILDFVKKNKGNVTLDSVDLFKIELETVVKKVDGLDILSKDNLNSDDYIRVWDESNKSAYKDIDELKDSYRASDNSDYLSQNGKIKVTIGIRKKYFLNKNENDFIFLSLCNFMKNIKEIKINDDLRKKIRVHILSDNINFESKFMSIFSDDYENDEMVSVIEEGDFENYKIEHGYFENKMKNLLYYPLTWWENSSSKSEISAQFVNLFFYLISVNTDLKSHKYVIDGDTFVTINLGYSNFDDNTLNKIYDLMVFCEDKLRIKDKILILKKSLVAHLPREANANDLIASIDVIEQSVKGVFDSYIENSLELFINQRNKLITEYASTAKKVGELIGGIESRLRDFTLSLLATSLLTFLEKNNELFRSALLNIAFVAYSLFCLINTVVVISICFRYCKTVKNMKNYRKSFGNVVKDFDFKSLEKKYVKSSKIHFWIMFCVAVFITTLTSVTFFMIYLGNRWNFKFGVYIIEGIKWLAGV